MISVSAALVLAGAAGSFWLRPLGIALIGLGLWLGVFVAIEYQRRVLNVASTLHRTQNSLRKEQAAQLEGALQKLQQEINALGSRTSTAGNGDVENKPQALAGRAATPDVTNSNTEYSLQRALTPQFMMRRGLMVGVFSDELQATLRDHGFHIEMLRPSTATEQMTSTAASTLVIDEEAMVHGDWAGTLQATGTTMASQLVKAIEVAKSRGLRVLGLAGTHPIIGVHRDLLRNAGVAMLPLRATELDEANRAPISPLLVNLQAFATHRAGG